MDESRRQFMKLSAALAGAGATTGLAGCSQLPFDVGGGPLGGGSNAFYRDWLYVPDEFSDDQEHYSFTAYRPSNWAEAEDELNSDLFDRSESAVQSALDGTDLDFDEVDTYMRFDGQSVSIATGEYDPETVREELGDNDFEEEEELDSGYTIHLGPNGERAIGVSGDALIVVSDVPQERSAEDSIGSGSLPDEEAQENLREISPGEVARGTMNGDDPEDSAREGNYEPVTFQGTAGEEVQITMRSRNGDTRLQLLNPDGEEVAENDDNFEVDGSLNSRITHTLEASGEYTIVATSFSSFASFEYTLELLVLYSPEALVDAVATVAGTQTEDTELYEEDVDAAADLFDNLGGGDLVFGYTREAVDEDDPEAGRFDEMVARGSSVTFNGETSSIQAVIIYDGEDDYDEGDLEDWVDEADQWDDVDDVSYSQNGRAGIISGTIDTDDIGN